LAKEGAVTVEAGAMPQVVVVIVVLAIVEVLVWLIVFVTVVVLEAKIAVSRRVCLVTVFVSPYTVLTACPFEGVRV